MLENAIRNPQAAHVGILRRRDIEDAVITPAEIVGWTGRRVVPRLLLQALIGIEGMLFALEFFLVGELLAGSQNLVLRLDMRGVRPGRFGVGVAATRDAQVAADARDLEARHKAFQISLLLIAEIGGHGCFEFHDARRYLAAARAAKIVAVRSIIEAIMSAGPA